MPSTFLFQLGQTVKDKVSGFTGVIRARSEYLTGCNVYAVQSRELKDNKPSDWVHFDENMLELLPEVPVLNPYATVEIKKPVKTGGPITPPQQKTS